jgi:hypothetical protein
MELPFLTLLSELSVFRMDDDLYMIDLGVPQDSPHFVSENPVGNNIPVTSYDIDGDAYSEFTESDEQDKSTRSAEERKLKQNIIKKLLNSSPGNLDTTYVGVLENLCDEVNREFGSNIASIKFIEKVEMLVYDLIQQFDVSLSEKYYYSLLAFNEVHKKYPVDHALKDAIEKSKIDCDEKKAEIISPLGATKELNNLNSIFDTFLRTAKVYGQFILEEYQFDNIDKSVREAMIGGIAGGEKFIVK